MGDDNDDNNDDNNNDEDNKFNSQKAMLWTHNNDFPRSESCPKWELIVVLGSFWLLAEKI